MAVMNYESPNYKQIEFEDSIFVTTDLMCKEHWGSPRQYESNEGIKKYIEAHSGVIKSSVTKTTNYLIYGDNKEETSKYRKAMEILNGQTSEIVILPASLFHILSQYAIVEFGSYPYEENGARKPIRWFVLRREGREALLLSMYSLYAKRYHEIPGAVSWETCTLRKWLNEDLYHAAFTESEKCRILSSTVVNEGSGNTEDRVFLLSAEEAANCLPEVRTAIRPTPYNLINRTQIGYSANRWWLRSAGKNDCNAAYVDDNGNISDYGFIANYEYGVCPAMWVELD